MTSYLSEFLVFVGVSIILVPIFQRLGFGSILGYLIAGILVGPFGFKLIHETENIAHISEFGVIFLLFMIGLEIKPRKLWLMRRHLLGLGGLQILFCTILFFSIGILCGLNPYLAGVIGFALSLSSTAFAVQNLTEKHLFNTEFGRGSFATLLMQDLIAIPALAVIPALALTEMTASQPHYSAWFGLLIIAGLVMASRFLFRPLFRMIASTRSRDLFTAMTLFIVIGVAALMQVVGLSAALGTFIAGVLLSESEYRNELEANLEPFKGLLMGLFFIAVGMGVNLDIVVQKPLLIASLTIAYIFAKSFLIYLVGRLFGMNHHNSKLMGLTIAQGGEFAFVIFAMLTPSETISILTVVITASMALNPLMMLADEKLSKVFHQLQDPVYDEINNETPQVIIAGFGRFGQIFARILRAQEIPFVAIDHDASHIDLVRRFGNKVYYGDASRKEILESAGAANAKYFILAIDDIETSIKTAEILKHDYPHLKIYARARNRGHVFDYMSLGVEKIKRETFDASVNFVEELLIDMGFDSKLAQRIVEKFKVHDELMMKKQFLVRDDDQSLKTVSQQGVAQLAEVLKEESFQSNI